MKKALLLLLVLLTNPYLVYATDINLECPSEVSPNSEFTCKLTGSSDYAVSGVEMNYNYSNSLSLLSFIPTSEWFGDGENKQISLISKNEVNGKFDIGILKFKSSNQTATVSLDNVKFYDTTNEAKDHSVESTYKSVKIKEKIVPTITPKPSSSSQIPSSENNESSNVSTEEIVTSTYLTDIIIENYNLIFYKETYEYELDIADENKLNITPILEDKSSTYKIIGNEKLVDGSIIKINIVSQDNEEKTYIIKIHKSKQEPSRLQNGKFKIGFIAIIGLLIICNIVRIVLKAVRRDRDE